MSQIPTEKYTVKDPARANAEITAFLESLAAAGKSPRCEVRYPNPGFVSDEEWAANEEKAFDALELVDGELRTLPPYAEMEAR